MFKWHKIINDIFTTFVATNITLHWPNVQENIYIHGVQKLLKPQTERSRRRKLKCQVYCGQQRVLELMWHHATDCYLGNYKSPETHDRRHVMQLLISLNSMLLTTTYRCSVFRRQCTRDYRHTYILRPGCDRWPVHHRYPIHIHPRLHRAYNTLPPMSCQRL